MKAFVITDIHSYFKWLEKALIKAGFDRTNPEHVIISCGDLLDRGPGSVECLQFVADMRSEGRIFTVMGNHETLLMKILNGYGVHSYDYSNGTVKTIRQIANASNKADLGDCIRRCRADENLASYLDNLEYYLETRDYMFVHGWIPEDLDLKAASWRSWESAMWLNGMMEWYNERRYPGKTVVCGHWHTSWGHTYLHNVGVEFREKYFTTYEGDPCDHIMHTEPFIDEGIIALDACTAYSHKINVLVIDNFEDQLEGGTLNE